MQQTILHASSGKVESKPSNDASLMKMLDAADKRKAKDNYDRENVENTNNIVPFIQLLTQQLASVLQSDKSSMGTKINNEDLKQLQQELTKLSQMGVTDNSLKLINAELSAIIAQIGSDGNISDFEKILAQLNLKLGDKNQISDKTAIKSNDLLQQLATVENVLVTDKDKINKTNISNTVTAEEILNRLKTLAEQGKSGNTVENKENTKSLIQGIKEAESQMNNLRFSEQQLKNAANNTDTLNMSKMDNIQMLLKEISDNSNLTAKLKISSAENNGEEISLTSVGNANGSNKSGIINNTSPADIVNQVAKEIKENFANDGGRIKITLNPPSLGSVEMDVSVRNNKVQVVLIADNKDVQQTLNNHIDQLKSSLQTQGLTIDRCDVLMQDKHDEFYRSFGNQLFQQGRPGQENSERDQEKDGEKIFTNTSIKNRQQSISRISSDTISLFA
jgi:flagellar hook-length control protein FliK